MRPALLPQHCCKRQHGPNHRAVLEQRRRKWYTGWPPVRAPAEQVTPRGRIAAQHAGLGAAAAAGRLVQEEGDGDGEDREVTARSPTSCRCSSRTTSRLGRFLPRRRQGGGRRDKTKGARALIAALNPDGAVSVGGGAKKVKKKSRRGRRRFRPASGRSSRAPSPRPRRSCGARRLGCRAVK